MEIKEINGDLLGSTAPCICHQVNCKGAMGAGIARSIREKWPVVFTQYKAFVDKTMAQGGRRPSSVLLGGMLPVRVSATQQVLNLFGEDSFGRDGRRYTDYEAIYRCLEKAAGYCVDNHIDRIALPYKMGAARGGADWDVILAMIKSAFKGTNVTIEIWRLD
jgi:O-acetyl-ADP-ribose deacetylase (regulator of RNase III)